MSEDFELAGTRNEAGREAGKERQASGVLPRLFSEMSSESTSTERGEAAGAAGGHEGGGDEGGAPREEVWEVLSPSESTGKVDRGTEPAVEEGQGSAGGATGHDELDEEPPDEHALDEEYVSPALAARRKGSPHKKLRRVEVKLGPSQVGLTAEQRLLVLDTWLRSGLSAGGFAPIVGLSHHTLYAWKKRFQELGPAGLDEKPRGTVTGSRLPEATRRAIVMMKQQHPDWGCDRIHDMLMRSAGFTASAGAIVRVLREEGYERQEVPTHPHPPAVHRFERARPNQLWQTDLFTFLLKRQTRRVYLVAFLDDHSRYLVGYGLHATSSGAMVREVFEGAIANYGAPEEVLTDNGSQYHTWRGKSRFRELCDRRGIKQIVSRPRHPQTLGKIERFWGSLWRECVEEAIFEDLVDARRRIGLYIDYYNFHRSHQGMDGLVPADRYFEAAPEVRETLRARVAGNALDLARHGEPRQSFYLTGRVGNEGISLHGEGGKVVLTKTDGTREEVDLLASGRRTQGAPSNRPPVDVREPVEASPPPEPSGPVVMPAMAEETRREAEPSNPPAPISPDTVVPPRRDEGAGGGA